jgi:superfamily II DNA or RNA helicase
VHNIGAEKLISEGWLMKPIIQFYEMQSAEGDGELYLDKYKIQIQNNPYRNKKIQDIVNILKDKKILILTKLIEHGDMLHQMIPGSKHLYGTTDKEARKQMMEDFREGKFNVLVSTINLWSEGIDIPSLDVIFNVGANRGDVRTIQSLGRVLRMLEGKKEAYYIDFLDSHKMFKTASKARMKILAKEGHEVQVMKNGQA